MSVTDGIGQTPCSFEHYLVLFIFPVNNDTNSRNLRGGCMTGRCQVCCSVWATYSAFTASCVVHSASTKTTLLSSKEQTMPMLNQFRFVL